MTDKERVYKILSDLIRSPTTSANSEDYVSIAIRIFKEMEFNFLENEVLNRSN